jgi:hypothetical protein
MDIQRTLFKIAQMDCTAEENLVRMKLETIAAGETTETIDITPIADLFFEGDETIILTLTAGETYELGDTTTATVTVSEPLPTVTILGQGKSNIFPRW